MIVISGGYARDETVETFSDNCSSVKQNPLAAMQSSRWNHSMVECQGSIYCFGNGKRYWGRQSEKYNDGTWQPLDNQQSFDFCVAVALNNEIFVFDENQILHKYSTEFNAWRTLTECPVKYEQYAACYMEGKVYAFGRMSCKERERFVNDSLCDATLQICDKEFKVHKCVVGVFSGFLRKLFKSEDKEKYDSFASMKGLSIETIEAVLTFMYTGSIEMNKKNVFDLFACAEHLLIDGLKTYCCNYLINKLSIGNLFEYYSSAKKYEMVSLKRKVMEMLTKNFGSAIKQNDFYTLNRNDLMYFLYFMSWVDSSAFTVGDACRGIMTWVEDDIQERKKFLPEMLAFVKFKNLPEHYLRKVVRNSLVEEISSISEIVRTEIEWKSYCSRGKDNDMEHRLVVVVENDGALHLFDPIDKTWRKLFGFQNAIGSCFVAHNDSLYVIGEHADPSSVQRFLLSGKDEFPPVHAGRCFERRGGSRAVVYKGEIVISGGDSDQLSVESFHLATRQCAQLEPTQTGRSNHSMVVCDGSLYCIGGSHQDGQVTEIYCDKSWEVFDKQKFGSCVTVATTDEILKKITLL